mmetsp:Transcript_53200/g.105652  ORF Transcript_53200/g.105652 Transcript_53200/m.105652 type:complete len:251 (-) Transcript_53200:27-779(-)
MHPSASCTLLTLSEGKVWACLCRRGIGSRRGSADIATSEVACKVVDTCVVTPLALSTLFTFAQWKIWAWLCGHSCVALASTSAASIFDMGPFAASTFFALAERIIGTRHRLLNGASFLHCWGPHWKRSIFPSIHDDSAAIELCAVEHVDRHRGFLTRQELNLTSSFAQDPCTCDLTSLGKVVSQQFPACASTQATHIDLASRVVLLLLDRTIWRAVWPNYSRLPLLYDLAIHLPFKAPLGEKAQLKLNQK